MTSTTQSTTARRASTVQAHSAELGVLLALDGAGTKGLSIAALGGSTEQPLLDMLELRGHVSQRGETWTLTDAGAARLEVETGRAPSTGHGMTTCPACQGRGLERGPDGYVRACRSCKGERTRRL